jgi:hypothetical protein
MNENLTRFQTIGKASVDLLPNFILFDSPPTKKKRLLLPVTEVKPEVHIAAGIVPTPVKPGEGSATIHYYEVPDSPIAEALSAPAEVGAAPTKSELPSTQPISAPEGLCDHPKRFSPLLFLLDCVPGGRVPSVEEVFKLIDHDAPGHNLDYVEAQIELQDLGYNDALDIYTLGVEHLATFGSLGMNGARFLYAYTEERIIRPLGIMNAMKSEPSVQEVAAPTETHFETQATQGDIEEIEGRPIDEESQETVLKWLEGVHDCEEIEEEEIDELETEEGSNEGDTGSMSDVAVFKFEESFEV